jgi:four helix bundle protein
LPKDFRGRELKKKYNFIITELQNQLLIAKDINYLSKEKFDELAKQTIEVHKLINGLIKSLKNA